MSTKITYMLVGAQGFRELTGVCDCGAESPEHEDAYQWGDLHRAEGCLR